MKMNEIKILKSYYRNRKILAWITIIFLIALVIHLTITIEYDVLIIIILLFLNLCMFFIFGYRKDEISIRKNEWIITEVYCFTLLHIESRKIFLSDISHIIKKRSEKISILRAIWSIAKTFVTSRKGKRNRINTAGSSIGIMKVKGRSNSKNDYIFLNLIDNESIQLPYTEEEFSPLVRWFRKYNLFTDVQIDDALSVGTYMTRNEDFTYKPFPSTEQQTESKIKRSRRSRTRRTRRGRARNGVRSSLGRHKKNISNQTSSSNKKPKEDYTSSNHIKIPSNSIKRSNHQRNISKSSKTSKLSN